MVSYLKENSIPHQLWDYPAYQEPSPHIRQTDALFYNPKLQNILRAGWSRFCIHLFHDYLHLQILLKLIRKYMFLL